MSDDSELRRNWRSRWLGSIQEFADDEVQQRTWLDTTNTNPHFSFVEYFCCYFDDLGLSDGGYRWALNKGLVSENEAKAVSDFHRAADSYDRPTDDYDHKAILADPKWGEVVAGARHAQAALLPLLDDPQDRRFLVER
jgi:hypothetical protein